MLKDAIHLTPYSIISNHLQSKDHIQFPTHHSYNTNPGRKALIDFANLDQHKPGGYLWVMILNELYQKRKKK